MRPIRPALAVTLLAACVGVTRYQRREPRPEDDYDEPSPPAVAEDERIAGPLSVVAAPPETPPAELAQARNEQRERYVGKKILDEDVAAFLAVVDRFFPSETPSFRVAHDAAHNELHGLAPESLDRTFNSFLFASERYHLCVRTPHAMWPCDRDLKPPPHAATAFELTEPAPGIAELAVHDLSNAADPAWAKLPTETLAKARAIIVDLRDAAGSDPRPLLPWLEAVTGDKPLQPLRAIERPADADTYVAAYTARFLPETRDRGVWASLVGPARPTAAHDARPIAVVVGRHCGAACELVARVLQARAGATVTGGVTRSGRLSRDEPALLELPHTKIDVFFHATRYVMSADIEAATGPSDEWSALVADPVDYDGTAYALREVEARLAGGWRRCDSFPAYSKVDALPRAVVAKLPDAFSLDKSACPDTQRVITVVTDLPLSALDRYLATCVAPLHVSSRWPAVQYELAAPDGLAALPALSQLAQSDVVQAVYVTCAPHFEPN